MAGLHFSWDLRKAKANYRKHAVSFGEAALRAGGRYPHSNHQRPTGRQVGADRALGKADEMRKEYDFSKSRRNPYVRRLKKQITIRLDEPTIQYFRQVSETTGIPYQTLINLYLRDCAEKGRKLSMEWRALA